jgi:hypothetical protein
MDLSSRDRHHRLVEQTEPLLNVATCDEDASLRVRGQGE